MEMARAKELTELCGISVTVDSEEIKYQEKASGE